MKEFLGDNIALSQRLDEINGPLQQPAWLPRVASPRMRDISSPSQWAICFLTYVAVRCPDLQVRDLLTYGRIVLQLQQRHGGHGWLEYDRAFRMQAAADSSAITWNALNPSLMAATVLAHAPPTGSTSFCHHCQGADHNPADCALLSVDPYLDPPRPRPYSTFTRARTRPSPYDSSVEICRRYNRGACPDNSSTCKFRHVCATVNCYQPGHTTQTCPLRADPKTPKPKTSA